MCLGGLRGLLVKGNPLVGAGHGQPLVGQQAIGQVAIHLTQEAGRKLVQQPANLFGGIGEQAGFTGPTVAGRLRTLQGVFE